ncbi:MAG TPA: membrane-bound PQQ-dependent dehydrogenase, glucose/quinate/shikimate family [Steroidobacteraceae bacterium]
MALTRLRRNTHWSISAFGGISLVFGLALLAGGLRLLALGGSWYYVLAGLCLSSAGLALALGRIEGAWLYAGLLAGTFLWTLWEVGWDFWGFVPRLALLLILSIILTLLLPRLDGAPARRVTRTITAALSLCLLGAVVWAFTPHHTFRSDEMPESPAISLASQVVLPPDAFIQPADAPVDEDWAAYGRSNAATRYSPLRQIHRENVRQLARAWVYRTGDMPVEGEKKWGAETTPLKIGERLYLCSAMNKLIALDAASGKELWKYDPHVSKEHIPYTAACRGVAFYEAPQLAADAPCKRRIIEGTLDARLIAVDAADGEPCADFGRDGQVSLTEGMGKVLPAMVAVTSPPSIIRGVAVVGHQVLDGQYRHAPSGVIRGYDAVTGELVWAWDMLHPDRKGSPPAREEYARGTPNSWTIASGDEELGLVYVPMGNSSGDYYSGSRSDIENRYSTSIVALDAMTGEVRWSFQTVHLDVWDYDLGSQPTLIDFPVGEDTVPALLVPTKQGDLYVLDRATGEPVLPVEEWPAPRGNVPGNALSPTQPHSPAMPVLRKPDLTEQDMWGLTPFDQLYCRIQFRAASYDGLYTAPTLGKRWIQWPGYNGGNDWGSVAVDVERGILVANYSNVPMYNQLITREEAEERGLVALGMPGGSSESSGPQPMIGTPYGADIAPWRLFTGMLCNDPPYGSITAIDLSTGTVLWDVPLGTARRNGPFGIPTYLPINIGTPNNGGPIVTAGGLIFIAAATDELLRAIDIETGKVLWTDALPAGGQATPMTYEVGGEQYVVVMAGGHHFMETRSGDYLIAYKLPRGLTAGQRKE